MFAKDKPRCPACRNRKFSQDGDILQHRSHLMSLCSRDPNQQVQPKKHTSEHSNDKTSNTRRGSRHTGKVAKPAASTIQNKKGKVLLHGNAKEITNCIPTTEIQSVKELCAAVDNLPVGNRVNIRSLHTRCNGTQDHNLDNYCRNDQNVSSVQTVRVETLSDVRYADLDELESISSSSSQRFVSSLHFNVSSSYAEIKSCETGIYTECSSLDHSDHVVSSYIPERDADDGSTTPERPLSRIHRIEGDAFGSAQIAVAYVQDTCANPYSVSCGESLFDVGERYGNCASLENKGSSVYSDSLGSLWERDYVRRLQRYERGPFGSVHLVIEKQDMPTASSHSCRELEWRIPSSKESSVEKGRSGEAGLKKSVENVDSSSQDALNNMDLDSLNSSMYSSGAKPEEATPEDELMLLSGECKGDFGLKDHDGSLESITYVFLNKDYNRDQQQCSSESEDDGNASSSMKQPSADSTRTRRQGKCVFSVDSLETSMYRDYCLTPSSPRTLSLDSLAFDDCLLLLNGPARPGLTFQSQGHCFDQIQDEKRQEERSRSTTISSTFPSSARNEAPRQSGCLRQSTDSQSDALTVYSFQEESPDRKSSVSRSYSRAVLPVVSVKDEATQTERRDKQPETMALKIPSVSDPQCIQPQCADTVSSTTNLLMEIVNLMKMMVQSNAVQLGNRSTSTVAKATVSVSTQTAEFQYASSSSSIESSCKKRLSKKEPLKNSMKVDKPCNICELCKMKSLQQHSASMSTLKEGRALIPKKYLQEREPEKVKRSHKKNRAGRGHEKLTSEKPKSVVYDIHEVPERDVTPKRDVAASVSTVQNVTKPLDYLKHLIEYRKLLVAAAREALGANGYCKDNSRLHGSTPNSAGNSTNESSSSKVSSASDGYLSSSSASGSPCREIRGRSSESSTENEATDRQQKDVTPKLSVVRENSGDSGHFSDWTTSATPLETPPEENPSNFTSDPSNHEKVKNNLTTFASLFQSLKASSEHPLHPAKRLPAPETSPKSFINNASTSSGLLKHALNSEVFMSSTPRTFSRPQTLPLTTLTSSDTKSLLNRMQNNPVAGTSYARFSFQESAAAIFKKRPSWKASGDIFPVDSFLCLPDEISSNLTNSFNASSTNRSVLDGT